MNGAFDVHVARSGDCSSLDPRWLVFISGINAELDVQ